MRRQRIEAVRADVASATALFTFPPPSKGSSGIQAPTPRIAALLPGAWQGLCFTEIPMRNSSALSLAVAVALSAIFGCGDSARQLQQRLEGRSASREEATPLAPLRVAPPVTDTAIDEALNNHHVWLGTPDQTNCGLTAAPSSGVVAIGAHRRFEVLTLTDSPSAISPANQDGHLDTSAFQATVALVREHDDDGEHRERHDDDRGNDQRDHHGREHHDGDDRPTPFTVDGSFEVVDPVSCQIVATLPATATVTRAANGTLSATATDLYGLVSTQYLTVTVDRAPTGHLQLGGGHVEATTRFPGPA